MSPENIECVATLRLAVGFLGEQGQAGWWPGTFLGASSTPFLSPVFPKTTVLAQCRGVTHAAARVHDERIGVGSVFHLFRLPEDIEQALHRLLEQQEPAQRLSSAVKDTQSALTSLKALAASKQSPGNGPVRVGRAVDLSTLDSWRVVAAHYAAGFQASSEVFPFFSAT
ncbi:MAG: BrxE family protein [Phycisphaeraceae bacterium]|nr:BrxE family protein [Phycisphaeraceae bacterium]